MIPVLNQTYDEVRRLAIAGSVVAPGDFRLKKLVPQLEQAGQKAPVFAKVAEAVARLVDSTEKTSAAALLELTTLINAILYTQGETGIDGEWTPIKTTDLGRWKTQASARVLKPLQEALTTKGSGRLEIIRDAVERNAFLDLRLIAPALAALDDSYAEIADLVANRVLPLYGQAIVPELQAKFDPKGRGGHVRRLLLMHQLDRDSARPYLQRALDDGSQEVRIAAIGCLGDSPDDLPYLLQQVKSKATDVRQAALRALGRTGVDDAVKVLCAAIDSADFSLAVEPINQSRDPVLTGYLLERAEKHVDALLTSKEKDAKKQSAQNERMNLFLDCLFARADARTEKLLLRMFDQAERLAALKGTPGGKDVVERLVSVMANGSPNLQKTVVDAHATLSPENLSQAFMAACRSRNPNEVFKLFSPYVSAAIDEKKKARDPEFARREAIVNQLLGGRHHWHYGAVREENDRAASLDPQWLDVAVKLERLELVQALAVPGHASANKLLARLFHERLGKSGNDYELVGVLDTMIRVGHPEATDATIELIKKASKSGTWYASYWLGHLIPRLPRAEALPKFEALLPTLPEKMIDQLLNAVTDLKMADAAPA